MVLSAPKSQAGRRTLALPKPLLELLSTHLARRGLTGAQPDELMFVAPDGGSLHYSNWRHRVWEPAIKTAKLHGLSFHDLRRASATVMVLSGVDLKTAQTRLGHSTPTLTLGIYAQVTDAADRAAADALGEHWIGARHDRVTGGDGRTRAPASLAP